MTQVDITPKQEGLGSLIGKMSGGHGLHSKEVFSWREVRFIEMGFSDREAFVLASTRIDLHDMEKLLKAGCSHDTAWQILTGTMWSGHDPLWRESEQGGYMDIDEDLPFEEDGA